MAKAKQLPSGNWNIRVGGGKSGKAVSFTASTKKEVELMAAEEKRTANRHIYPAARFFVCRRPAARQSDRRE